MITDIENYIEGFQNAQRINDRLYVTNEELIINFENDCRLRGFTKRTQHNHVQIVKIYLELIGENHFHPQKTYLDYRHGLLMLKHYCDSNHHSHSTLNNYYSAISAFYSFLIDCGLATLNPTLIFRQRYLAPFKMQKEKRQLVSTDEIERIIKCTEYPYNVCAFVLAKTGLRRGEFCRLNISNFNFNKKIIILSDQELNRKRSNNRVPLDNQTIEVIKYHWKKRIDAGEHVSETSPAFSGKRGYRINGEYLRLYIREGAKKAGVHKTGGALCERFSPHCFRHWMTTVLVDSGIDGSYVDEIRGDSRDRARDTYHHISDKKLVEVYQQHIPQLSFSFE